MTIEKVSLERMEDESFNAYIISNIIKDSNYTEIWINRIGYGISLMAYGTAHKNSKKKVKELDRFGYFDDEKKELLNFN